MQSNTFSVDHREMDGLKWAHFLCLTTLHKTLWEYDLQTFCKIHNSAVGAAQMRLSETLANYCIILATGFPIIRFTSTSSQPNDLYYCKCTSKISKAHF